MSSTFFLLLLEFFADFYYQKTGRILGCQSKNHSACSGQLWTCERCGKRVCFEEGSTDLPDLCDDCWFQVRENGMDWSKE
jgi:hypothetical protein